MESPTVEIFSITVTAILLLIFHDVKQWFDSLPF